MPDALATMREYGRELMRQRTRELTTEETLELVVAQRDEWRMACYCMLGLFLFILLMARR